MPVRLLALRRSSLLRLSTARLQREAPRALLLLAVAAHGVPDEWVVCELPAPDRDLRQLAERRAVERREAAVQQLSRQHEQLERAATEHGVRHDRAVGQARRSHWGHLERLRGCRGGPSVVQAEEALQGLLRADEGRLELREPPLRGCLRQHVRLLRALRRRLSMGRHFQRTPSFSCHTRSSLILPAD